jgi:hypothetical protein
MKFTGKMLLAVSALSMLAASPAFAVTPISGAVPGGAYATVKVNKNGALIGRGNDNNDLFASVSLSSGTAAALFAAPAAGIKNCITNIEWEGVTATTAVNLTVLDGVTVKATFTVPAGVSQRVFSFERPLCSSAAAAMNAQLSGSPTGAVQVNATGFKVLN